MTFRLLQTSCPDLASSRKCIPWIELMYASLVRAANSRNIHKSTGPCTFAFNRPLVQLKKAFWGKLFWSMDGKWMVQKSRLNNLKEITATCIILWWGSGMSRIFYVSVTCNYTCKNNLLKVAKTYPPHFHSKLIFLCPLLSIGVMSNCIHLCQDIQIPSCASL